MSAANPVTRGETARKPKRFAHRNLEPAGGDASLGVGALVRRSVGIGAKASDEVAIDCTSDELPRIMPQTTEVRCCGYAGPTLWRRFKAWRLRLDCHLLDEDVTVSCWFNLGQGDKPKAGRGSKYRKAWIMANDGEVPRRNDRLWPAVFLDKIFKVKIRDAGTGLEKYSVIDDLLEKTAP